MSKKLKLSPWHDIEVQPKKIGLYKLQQPYGERLIFSWWEDGLFNGAWSSLEEAYENRDWGSIGCACTAEAWRGVLK